MIYLDKNIAVVTYNVDSTPPYDDILDTVALDTAYKIHILLAFPKDKMLCDQYREDNLYDMLDALVDANTTGRPIYVHLPNGFSLPDKLKPFIMKRVTFIQDKNVKKYRFGDVYLMRRKSGYYIRVSKNTYMNPVNKWCKLHMDL